MSLSLLASTAASVSSPVTFVTIAKALLASVASSPLLLLSVASILAPSLSVLPAFSLMPCFAATSLILFSAILFSAATAAFIASPSGWAPCCSPAPTSATLSPPLPSKAFDSSSVAAVLSPAVLLCASFPLLSKDLKAIPPVTAPAVAASASFTLASSPPKAKDTAVVPAVAADDSSASLSLLASTAASLMPCFAAKSLILFLDFL
ncbi:hypothetical protein F0310_05605 (plasmid) [Borrelia sp. A-FGy1]|nr:hypothetical protein F0310_05605 [Borrelia sp. A-FGy1]